MNDFQAQQVLKPYPLFRLTFFLVAGIFFALNANPEGKTAEECGAWGGFLVLLWLAMGGWLFLSRYRSRFLFGLLAFAFAAGLGVLLGKARIRAVHYDWPAEPVVYRAALLERPQEKAKTFLCRLRVDFYYPLDTAGERGRGDAGERQRRGCGPGAQRVPVHKVVWAYVMKEGMSGLLTVGEFFYFYGQVEPLHPSEQPGEFDYPTYLWRKGVSGTAVIFAGHWQRTGEREPLTWKQRALELRERLLAKYREWGFRGDEYAVLSALTLGYKEDLSEEVRTVYRQAGVSHVLALSGMHVAILWGLLAYLLRPLELFRAGRWLKCLLLMGALWGFAFLVGLPASVVRAVVMCTLLLMAQAASSETASLNSLSVAAAVMLCFDPFYLWDVGFQLSFLAVFSILVCYPLIFPLVSFRQPVLRYVWSVMAVSLAAQWGTAPLILYYFSHFPVHFLWANVWVAPWVCLLVYGAVCLWITSPWGMVHGWVVSLLQVLLKGMNGGLKLLAAWPWADAVHLQGSFGMVVVSYLLLACGWMGVVYRSRKLCIPFLLLLHGWIGIGFYQSSLSSSREGLYLSAGQVKAFPEQAVWQSDSLYRYRGVTVCLIASDRWRNWQSPHPLSVDYLYLCRGCRGSMAALQSLFRIRKVVLDGSLSTYWRQRYEEECRQLGLDYVALEAKGSYRIFPEIRN